MKRKLLQTVSSVLILSGMFMAPACYCQSQSAVIKKYLTDLPSGKPEDILRKYRMTAVYTNMDLYGKFMNKTKVTGDYTRGLGDGYVTWNNVYISNSNSFSDPFPPGTKQEYIENMKYIPSDKMVQKDAFKNFPSNPENVFARNLIWDMMGFEIYSWMFWDSLKLNKPHEIAQMNFEFDMAEIGKYKHNKVTLCWKGISEMDGELCAVIDFNAIDNIVELTMDQINLKGTEQYWGTVWLSLKTKNIEKAYMYGGIMMEMDIKGMPNKLLIKTVRELDLVRIQ